MFETTESWIVFKLIYYIDDYGRQYIIGDEVLEKTLTALEKAKIPIAPTRIEVVKAA
jgi:hypothetical protein